jgi:hypothetical protein
MPTKERHSVHYRVEKSTRKLLNAIALNLGYQHGQDGKFAPVLIAIAEAYERNPDKVTDLIKKITTVKKRTAAEL